MNRILRIPCRGSLMIVAVAWALLAMGSIAPAQSSAQLDKHARKIEKRLAKFQPGTYLDFDFRDSSQSYGSLGALSEVSFQFTNADSNLVETHSYTDLAHVKKAKEYIGAGSEGGRHVRMLVPVLIGAAAAGAAVAVVEVVR